jgi:hypothetical protein
MAFAYYGADVTPATLSDCMDTKACPFNWLSGATCSGGKATWVNRYAFSWSRLEQELNQNNRPVVLGMHRTTNVNDTHWVLVLSGQGSDPANYTMHDPWLLSGANMRLSTRSGDYVFDWLSIYAGEPVCSVVDSATPTVSGVQPEPILLSQNTSQSTDSVHVVNAPSVISGTTWVYYMTEITMTIQLTANSNEGNVTEMLVWSNSDPNTNWQPFVEFAWLPVSDFVYAQFRDEFGNVSEVESDTIYPVYSPPTFDIIQDFLPFIVETP